VASRRFGLRAPVVRGTFCSAAFPHPAAHLMQMRATSPLLEREIDCRLVRSIPTRRVLEAYRRDFGYDASAEFAGVDSIHLLECPESGLRFFVPPSVVGREGLYRQLQTFDWNYKETKWEHDDALRQVQAGQRVLDVGCGKAAFLHRCRTERGAVPTGLEFNDAAAQAGRARGVEVVTETVEAHAGKRPGHYDVVTSFQVLEHVTTPAAFVRACIQALKPGGSLLIGVPNHDSFLGQAEDNWLDMPPHHMSLWSRACLEGLGPRFGVRHVATWLEPLQELDWYQAVQERTHLRGWLQRALYHRLGFDRFFRRYLAAAAPTIAGHTVLARFVKA
jgi:2-polyprenyl-3-methyl-5-hydroxy-6-metoxy-1,4-benzoquinol methylase